MCNSETSNYGQNCGSYSSFLSLHHPCISEAPFAVNIKLRTAGIFFLFLAISDIAVHAKKQLWHNLSIKISLFSSPFPN